MTDPIRPHPQNVDGPFYVEFGCCTSCDVPMQEAPGHFAYDGDFHCYVCRQPRSENEIADLISAAWMSEFECIRYRGTDAGVLRRLAELDLRHVCDTPPPPQFGPIIRNHVRIVLAGTPTIATPEELAQEFVDYLMSRNDDRRLNPYRVRKAQSSSASYALEIAWYEDHFHRVEFRPVNAPSEWHVFHPLTQNPSDRSVGFVLAGWLESDPLRFTNVRWSADPDGQAGESWQSRPW